MVRDFEILSVDFEPEIWLRHIEVRYWGHLSVTEDGLFGVVTDRKQYLNISICRLKAFLVRGRVI